MEFGVEKLESIELLLLKRMPMNVLIIWKYKANSKLVNLQINLKLPKCFVIPYTYLLIYFIFNSHLREQTLRVHCETKIVQIMNTKKQSILNRI